MIKPPQNITSPVLFERFAKAINTALATGLNGLDYNFTHYELTEKQIMKIGQLQSDIITFPSIYSANKEYQNLSPSQDLGNYSFFYIEDDIIIPEYRNGVLQYYDIEWNLIFYWDYTKFTTVTDIRSKQTVLNNIIKSISFYYTGSGGTGEINGELKTYVKKEDIFSDYDLKQQREQYLMQPFDAIRINGNVKIYDKC
jgi:hypothetical protein